MKTIIRLYRSRGWRWQMRDARNGRVIGASTEAYMRQSSCLRNLERVTGILARGPWRGIRVRECTVTLADMLAWFGSARRALEGSV